MKILYISSVPSKEQFDFMNNSLKSSDFVQYGMQESGFKFHHLIIDGIVKNGHELYSIVGRTVAHKTHRGLFWRKKINVENGVKYYHLGFINLPVLKNIVVSIGFLFNTLKWLRKNRNEEKCIILDASYITVIPFINLATKIRKCSKVAIVCDIYEYMANVEDSREKHSKIHRLIARVMQKSYQKMSGFIFLTEAMNDVLNKNNKPYIVMEGLVDVNMTTTNNDLAKKNKKDIIMYAGALREKYGLKNLLEGYHKYKNDNSELWIFGAGDYVNNIEKISKIDKRIKYFGIKPNEEIVKKEIEATLLINPRPSNLEFTKYSFPSKNMEYMVSGTPILTSKLPGMPKEYYNYIYTIDEDSVESILKALTKILNLDKEELFKKGLKAKEFVLKKKNNVYQTKRIIKLCKEVVK